MGDARKDALRAEFDSRIKMESTAQPSRAARDWSPIANSTNRWD